MPTSRASSQFGSSSVKKVRNGAAVPAPLLVLGGFLLGVLCGAIMTTQRLAIPSSENAAAALFVSELLLHHKTRDLTACPPCPCPRRYWNDTAAKEATDLDEAHHMEETATRAALTATTLSRRDIGYAWDATTAETQDVLVLYTTAASLPNTTTTTSSSSNNDDNDNNTLPKLDLENAIQNCRTLKVVTTQPVRRRKSGSLRVDQECFAMVPQWEGYHVHKFQRAKRRMVYGDFEYAAARNLGAFYDPPSVDASNKAIVTYLSAMDGALERLRPLAKQASLGGANGKKTGPIIVLVTNFGQSNMLLNLVCSAKSRNVDLSRVLLFATDQETFDLAQHLKLHVFYDAAVFASIPKEAGADYSSMQYAHSMMAEVYAVHLPLLLGHDLLFLDVDIALYKDPLVFFEKHVTPEFDMYFQHDGFHHPDRFAPLAANTGVYFVCHNQRTLHFFNQLVQMGDQILLAKSHQAVVTTLVNEHMSRTGLRVKILSDYQDQMPNGWAMQTARKITQYMRAQYMPRLPYLFHPNWRNKEEKRDAFISTHNWFLHASCYSTQSDELNRTMVGPDILTQCCLAAPQPAFSGGAGTSAGKVK